MYLGGCSRSRVEFGQLPNQTVGPIDKSSWPELAQLALGRIRAGGADYGDIRLLESRREMIRAEDRRISGVSDRFDSGYGIRVLYDGAWGFAADCDFDPASVKRTAERAVEVARASRMLMENPVQLAPEPVHKDRVKTPRQEDPFKVSLEEKTELLMAISESVQSVPGVERSTARLWTQSDIKHFASTEESVIDFDLLAVGGQFGATAIADGNFESREFIIPYRRTGFEHIRAHDMLSHAKRIGQEAVEKLRADQPAEGRYDLVLDPAHLALTIHESCGHPTELDRALGYEANYAGTSFLTPEKLNSFQYGSEHVTLLADNERPGAMASTGYDDDGVAGQRWPIVENGVFRGYSTNREVARSIGESRSRGSCRADSWSAVPIVRIANVGLEPGRETLDSLISGIDRGILIEGRGSFSIDQKRYNFQFGGDAFWEIKNGKKTNMIRDVIYQGITPEFWNSCDGVADRNHWREYGFITCGKGQPGQSGWMTHAAPHARFRQIRVMNPTA
jgi:TldD protein